MNLQIHLYIYICVEEYQKKTLPLWFSCFFACWKVVGKWWRWPSKSWMLKLSRSRFASRALADPCGRFFSSRSKMVSNKKMRHEQTTFSWCLLHPIFWGVWKVWLSIYFLHYEVLWGPWPDLSPFFRISWQKTRWNYMSYGESVWPVFDIGYHT